MYRILKIGGKDYKLEYTIEASLYDECMEKLIDFFSKTMGGASNSEVIDTLPIEQKAKFMEHSLRTAISGMLNVPQTALTLFYAGLLENHGASGDRTVMSKDDAKTIIKQYFADHAEDGTDNFYDLMLVCMEQMGEDGFFKRTGLEKMMSEVEKKRSSKVTQDHKRRGGK